MDINKLLDEVVIHKTFGRGVISSIDNKYVIVEFKEINKISKFGYPAGFDGFLSIENREKQEDMEKELEVWREESGAEKKEELKQQYLKTQQAIMESKTAIGRKMDFLIQEFNREANTIGSKAQDVEIAKKVIDIKAEIEKIREQVQNIE